MYELPLRYKQYLRNAIKECKDCIIDCHEKIKLGFDTEHYRNRIEFYERKIEEIEDIL